MDEVLGEKPFISNDDITKLRFTTMFIKESLRMYPPVPQITRTVVKPVSIDGLRIPENSSVAVSKPTCLKNFIIGLLTVMIFTDDPECNCLHLQNFLHDSMP